MRLLVGAERGQAANFAQRSLCRFHLELKRLRILASLQQDPTRSVRAFYKHGATSRGQGEALHLLYRTSVGAHSQGSQGVHDTNTAILDTHGRPTAASLPLPPGCLVQARARRANDDDAHTRPAKQEQEQEQEHTKQQRSWLHSILQHRPPTAIRRTTPGNLPSYFSYPRASNHHPPSTTMPSSTPYTHCTHHQSQTVRAGTILRYVPCSSPPPSPPPTSVCLARRAPHPTHPSTTKPREENFLFPKSEPFACPLSK